MTTRHRFPAFRVRLVQCVCSIPALALLLLLGTIAYHYLLSFWMNRTGAILGAVTTAYLVPFYAAVDIHPTRWLVPALLVLASFLLIFRRLLNQREPNPFVLLMTAFVLFHAIGLSVSMIGGFQDFKGNRIPSFEVPYSRFVLEYFGDVPKIDKMGVRHFLHDYASPAVYSKLSLHSKTHPPGGAVFMWAVSRVFGWSLLPASLATVTFTSLILLPVWLTAKLLYGNRTAAFAVALFLVIPNFVMYTTTSMDGPFSVFPAFAVFFFLQAAKGDRPALFGALAGLATAFSAFMTYSTIFLGLFFAVYGLLTLLSDRAQFQRTVVALLAAALCFELFYAALFAATGFDILQAATTSVIQAEHMVGSRHESIGRYVNFGLGNLAAFLIETGFVLTAAWLKFNFKAVREALRGTATDHYSLAFLISLILIAFSTLYSMETERIWLFMVPFVAIPAAKYVHDLCERESNLEPFWWVAGLLCLQLVVSETMLNTFW